MKPSWARKLAVQLALACAVAQLALGSSLIVSAVALGLYSTHAHAHSLVLQADGDHVDLVLSHDEGDGHDREVPAHGGAHAVSVSHGDHVLHVGEGDATNAKPRRALPDSAPVLATSIGFPGVVARAQVPRTSLAPGASGVDQLRTIVLRL